MHEAMYNYNKTLESGYDSTKLEIYSVLHLKVDPISNWGNNLKKRVTFDDMVPFINED